MKKKVIILLIITILLTTGCTVVRIDTSSINNIVDVVLSKDNSLYNQVGRGYKYYVPSGVTYIDSNEYNDRLYSNGVYYYLYIDIVSYYYKQNINYEKNEAAYFFKEIDVSGNKGYLEVTENNNQYHVLFIYNHAVFEAMTTKEDVNTVILNASYILSTVKFNDTVIELMLNSDFMLNREEKYPFFSSTEASSKFGKLDPKAVVEDETNEEE